jgi:copper chaperone CopZ
MIAVTVCVPGLTCRHAVRVVSARLRDVPGVQSVEVDAPAGLVVVRGPVEAREVRAALVEVGKPPNFSSVDRTVGFTWWVCSFGQRLVYRRGCRCGRGGLARRGRTIVGVADRRRPGQQLGST